MCQKILHGTPPSKVSHHWKLLIILESLPSLLSKLSIILTSHIKRDANSLVDYLANQGVTSLDIDINTPWTAQFPPVIQIACKMLSQ